LREYSNLTFTPSVHMAYNHMPVVEWGVINSRVKHPKNLSPCN